MSDTRERTIKALARDGLTLEDYEATVFVVIDFQIAADSETLEDAKVAVWLARSYGEHAFYYEYDGKP